MKNQFTEKKLLRQAIAFLIFSEPDNNTETRNG
jgi:hypothetical protein